MVNYLEVLFLCVSLQKTWRGHLDRDLDVQLSVQSVSITTKFVRSNTVHGEVYSIKHYMIKFGSDLRQAGGFFPGTPVFPTNKSAHYYITEILLKVA